MNEEQKKEIHAVKPFIESLLVEIGLDADVSVFDSAIEIGGGYARDIDGWAVLYRVLCATPEQIRRAITASTP